MSHIQTAREIEVPDGWKLAEGTILAGDRIYSPVAGVWMDVFDDEDSIGSNVSSCVCVIRKIG